MIPFMDWELVYGHEMLINYTKSRVLSRLDVYGSTNITLTLQALLLVVISNRVSDVRIIK
ncbi:hypothetical protein D3C78_1863310 [compost metagenome]